VSGAAARTLVFLAFAVTGVVLAVGLILPGRGLLADALRDILAPWFGAGRWLLPPALIAFGIWFERRAEKSRASILRAIELNEVAIDQNKAAFTWGRRAAHDGAGVQRLLAPAQVISLPARRQSLDELVERRSEFLTAYQDAAYAQRYRAFVEKVGQREAPLGKTLLSESVARYLFKLMAYKAE
jgi:indolepyruvate ferredoxin oxidoreductase